ncbi:MAG: prenyltransferase/squalene oxidase repeat-containing protein [Planctomycetota bacterium]
MSLLFCAIQGEARDAGQSTQDETAASEAVVSLYSEALWPEMQAASERGLSWLAKTQSPAGYWQADVGHKRMDDYLILRSAEQNEALGQGHIGVTSLAGMAFLAGGHLPDRGEFGQVVRRTVNYVLEHVNDNGIVSDGGTRMYSHAFATLFLAEVHGMGAENEIRQGLEKAVHIIIDCQNAQGGWRYNAFSEEADLSVTVCQLQALRAARNIGIQVPKSTIDRAVDYVMRSRTTRGPYTGLFYYKIAGRGAYDKNREYAINAAALTSLFTAGIYEKDIFDPVLGFLEEEYPKVAEWYSDHYYFWYGNYYACQAFFQAGGVRFRNWFEELSRDLLRFQRSDGRWINRVGPGDPFSTAVACLMLQIPKQYLPIFQR